MKLPCLVVALLMMPALAPARTAPPPPEPSFAVAASPAYAQQVLQGRLGPRPEAEVAPPLLGASFASAGPAQAAPAMAAAGTVSPVPEPGGLTLILAGLAALMVVLSRRPRSD